MPPIFNKPFRLPPKVQRTFVYFYRSLILSCFYWMELQRAEMRMVRWMCGVKLKDRLPSKELRERLGVDDVALVLQQNRLRWYGHVLRKDDGDWVKKCMEYEVEGSRPRGRPKTWKEVVREDCQARKLNKEDAMDRCKWRKVMGVSG